MNTHEEVLEEDNHKLIVALDNLSEKEAEAKIREISWKCKLNMNNVIFKFNDLMADVWLRWIKKVLNRWESVSVIQRLVVEADFMLNSFWINWLKEYFYWKWAWVMLDPKWHDIPNTDAKYCLKSPYHCPSNAQTTVFPFIFKIEAAWR